MVRFDQDPSQHRVLKHLYGSSGRHNNRNGRGQGRLSKIEFPKFNGDDVKGWVFRCKQFFKIDGVVDDYAKIELVSMHVYEKALVWHQRLTV